MALTPNIRAQKGVVLSVTQDVTPNIRSYKATGLSVVNYPTPLMKAQKAFMFVATVNTLEMRAEKAFILAIVRGRSSDPKLRAWTFTLDGHDFYVLRLGTDETLVYDTHSEQWSVYGSHDGDLWRPFDGINWQGGGRWMHEFGSNVIVGDDGNGALYFLDPDSDLDDSALYGSDDPLHFERIAQGPVVFKGYQKTPCYGVSLLGSIGESVDDSLTGVTLYTSDDRGHTYSNQGTITTTLGSYDTRLDWRSLGSMSTPGRLFKIVDNGSLKRIDSLEMKDGPVA